MPTPSAGETPLGPDVHGWGHSEDVRWHGIQAAGVPSRSAPGSALTDLPLGSPGSGSPVVFTANSPRLCRYAVRVLRRPPLNCCADLLFSDLHTPTVCSSSYSLSAKKKKKLCPTYSPLTRGMTHKSQARPWTRHSPQRPSGRTLSAPARKKDMIARMRAFPQLDLRPSGRSTPVHVGSYPLLGLGCVVPLFFFGAPVR